MRRADLIGKQFNRLIVIAYEGSNKHKHSMWLCKCVCGNEVVVSTNSLNRKNTRSCGCLQKEKATNQLMSISKTHGLSKDNKGNKTRLFRIWTGIKTRCLNPNCQEYQSYGGRGIAVAKEWLEDYKAFNDWAISNGYLDTLSIDRIDIDGNYEPENCRWVDAKTQANNRTNNRIIKHKGVEKTMAQWARSKGLSSSCLYERLRRGWSIEKALETPVGSKKTKGVAQYE